MKRTGIGVGLLIALLLAGIFSARWMERHHMPLAGLLSQAARAAMAEEWEQAHTLTSHAEQAWSGKRRVTAAFADHGPMEEIDGLFAELEVFYLAGEQVHFATTCRDLSRKLEAMGDAHSLRWWNIL